MIFAKPAPPGKRPRKPPGPMATRNAGARAESASRRPLFLVAAGIAVGLLLLAGGYGAWKAMPDMPVREVTFGGALQRTSQDELQGLSRGISGNLWKLDLDAIRANVKRLPWVRDAEVRRVFPGRVAVTIEEHVPVAYWTERLADRVAPPPAGAGEPVGLVNSHAEVFRAAWKEPLPVWSGPPGSAAEVMKAQARFTEILAPAGLKTVELRLSPRRAWQVKLDNGATLELGRVDMEARLERFVRAHAQLAALQAPGIHADLRYATGLALRVAPELRSLKVSAAAVAKPAAPRKR